MRIVLLLSNAAPEALELARAWRDAGDQVELVLLDGAVAAARRAHPLAAALKAVLAAGVAVSAHQEALSRRGVTEGGLLDGVKAVELDEVADLVAEGSDKAVWL